MRPSIKLGVRRPGTAGELRLGSKASRISGWVRFSEPNCGQHPLFQIWEQVAEWGREVGAKAKSPDSYTWSKVPITWGGSQEHTLWTPCLP